MKESISMTEAQRYKELFQIYGKCVLVGCGCQFFQQFVGINTIMYYGPKIILATGITIPSIKDDATLGIVMNLPLAFMNAAGSTVAVFVIDKMGRRFVMLRCLPGVCGSCLLVALAMYLCNYTTGGAQTAGNVLALIALIVYLGFFSVGMSSTVWAVCAEIFPIHLIGSATALTTTMNWLANFAVSSSFLSLLEPKIGKVLAFVILGAFSAAAIAFVYFLVPETGGKPISENVKNIIGRDVPQGPNDALPTDSGKPRKITDESVPLLSQNDL